MAVSCDAIQVYRGLEALSGAATLEERKRLEHRLLGLVDVQDEFSAGRFADLAHREVDALLAQGRRPIVVGGTGLYLRAALSDLDLRPPVPEDVRRAVEREIAARGAASLHAELDPDVAATVHPHDRKRVARWTELKRAGIEPPASSEGLWRERLRRPTRLIGLTMDRDELAKAIDARVEAMASGGARAEAVRADDQGASRTARAALGFDHFLADDVEGVKQAHRAYARRQLTWMRRMEGVEVIDRTGKSDSEVADRIVHRTD